MNGYSNVPDGYHDRPVAIIGCGVMGPRIASIWASKEYDVRMYNLSPEKLKNGVLYVEEYLSSITGSSPPSGMIQGFDSLAQCVKGCWLVIEAIPEYLDTKVELFGQLEKDAPCDAILATNSSSYMSSMLVQDLSPSTKKRILNTHYQIPPIRLEVDLMTCGYTDKGIMRFMKERQEEVGTIPYIVQLESMGFIVNRIWAAIKREVLNVLAQGISTPAEIDELWQSVRELTRHGPCRMMDQIGLDTVAAIEANYVKELGLSPVHTVDFLNNFYLSRRKLGAKCPNGGFYSNSSYNPLHSNGASNGSFETPPSLILALDNALGQGTPKKGRILAFNMMGEPVKVLASDQFLPDGIDVDKSAGRIFWTCMGYPGKREGAVYTANSDGSDIRSLFPVGTIDTPKQLHVGTHSKKLYFADPEGKRVYRCDYDGTDLEILVDNNGSAEHSTSPVKKLLDTTNWCVGITVSHRLGKIFWSQKGPSKAGMGRIFSANIHMPEGQDAISRTDRQCILHELPEPIDLDIDENRRMLYWTDRGELPFGNSVNCVQLDEKGVPHLGSSHPNYTLVVRDMNEALGLKLDLIGGRLFFTDLCGTLYSSKLDGTCMKTIYSGPESFTGITLL